VSDIHQLPNPDEAEREASEWTVRLNSVGVTGEERARFEKWRTAHPRHAHAYEELSATWERFAAAGPLVRAVSFGQSMNYAARRRPMRVSRVYAAAAACAVIALSGWWYFARLASGSTFQTAIGEHASVALPDGSSLELNSSSAARVDFTMRSRLVRLDRGEAYFKVAHDVKRPFWVVAQGSWVRAVGTAFNVDVRPGGVQITVSEGTVKVAGDQPGNVVPTDDILSRAAVSVLTVGEQIDMHGHTVDVRALKPQEVTRRVAWRGGKLEFENQPLGGSGGGRYPRSTGREDRSGDPDLR
jgi:transmembrane sensor